MSSLDEDYYEACLSGWGEGPGEEECIWAEVKRGGGHTYTYTIPILIVSGY